MVRRGICVECGKSIAMLDRARPTLHTHICADGKPSRGVDREFYKKLMGEGIKKLELVDGVEAVSWREP